MTWLIAIMVIVYAFGVLGVGILIGGFIEAVIGYFRAEGSDARDETL